MQAKGFLAAYHKWADLFGRRTIALLIVCGTNRIQFEDVFYTDRVKASEPSSTIKGKTATKAA